MCFWACFEVLIVKVPSTTVGYGNVLLPPLAETDMVEANTPTVAAAVNRALLNLFTDVSLNYSNENDLVGSSLHESSSKYNMLMISVRNPCRCMLMSTLLF